MKECRQRWRCTAASARHACILPQPAVVAHPSLTPLLPAAACVACCVAQGGTGGAIGMGPMSFVTLLSSNFR